MDYNHHYQQQPKDVIPSFFPRCTIIILTAGLCWAYVLGEVCAIVSDMNEETQAGTGLGTLGSWSELVQLVGGTNAEFFDNSRDV